MMSSRHIKWLIIGLPTITVACWEYVRHQWLLPYLSMEAGNWLTAVIVFVITLLFIPKLFQRLDSIQEQLQQAKITQAALHEREQIASELHDGMAQLLFLLSVKVDRLKKVEAKDEEYRKLRQTVRQLNDYVRQAIANLRRPPQPMALAWTDSLVQLVKEFQTETGIPAELDWQLSETRLTMREKVELYAMLRESLANIRKHAGAKRVWVSCGDSGTGWSCVIQDDGKGFEGNPFRHDDRFGLQMMKSRADEMGWALQLKRENDRTMVVIHADERNPAKN